MTSKDKTRQRLVGSMRKTKVAAGIGTDDDGKDSLNAAAKAAKPVKPVSNGVNSAESSLRDETSRTDGYQSGRRVWPD